MTRFPNRFVALSCALLAGTLLASCASDPSDNARTQGSTPSASPLTVASDPPNAAAGSGKDSSAKPTPRDASSKPAEPSESTSSPKADSEGEAQAQAPAKRPDAPDASRTRIASSLPNGDEQVLEDRRMVALYGVPGTPELGALGEQSLAKSITRVKRLANSYDGLTKDDVVPTFELIASVASTSAGDDGNFSSELSLSTLRPWVERAGREGVYVVLDLQPGRADFVRQAKRYAPLLEYPHVGLALDPEWRLGPKQRHLEQIGSVRASEVNDTIDWLGEFTQRHDLPQKLLVLHQFRHSMVTNRKDVRTGHDAVSVLIHADGQGTQGDKRSTWKALHKGAPKGVRWGWKNFIDEDHPMLTPKQTYQVTPAPDFVSYQ